MAVFSVTVIHLPISNLMCKSFSKALFVKEVCLSLSLFLPQTPATRAPLYTTRRTLYFLFAFLKIYFKNSSTSGQCVFVCAFVRVCILMCMHACVTLKGQLVGIQTQIFRLGSKHFYTLNSFADPSFLFSINVTFFGSENTTFPPQWLAHLSRSATQSPFR